MILILENVQLEKAMKLEHRLMNIQLAVMKYNTGILFVKAAMDWFPGYYGRPMRKPLLRLDEKSLSGLKSAFIANGFQLSIVLVTNKLIGKFTYCCEN